MLWACVPSPPFTCIPFSSAHRLDAHRNARAVECTGPLRVTYGTDDALERATQAASETAAALDAQIAFAVSPLYFWHSQSRSCLFVCCSTVEKELQEALDTVHMYNDVKDAAQALMGRFGVCFPPFSFFFRAFHVKHTAVLEQVTVREVHERFGVDDIPE